jgi:hypothetical protein
VLAAHVEYVSRRPQPLLGPLRSHQDLETTPRDAARRRNTILDAGTRLGAEMRLIGFVAAQTVHRTITSLDRLSQQSSRDEASRLQVD